MSDASLNTFFIDPQNCSVYSCKKNTDGSYDISLTLYFAPQAYTMLGLVISVASGLLVLLLVVILFLKKGKHGKKI